MDLSNKQTADWQAAHCIPHHKIPEQLQTFLFDPGSTTQRMQREYAAETEVKILRQQWDYPHQQEALQLIIPLQQQALIREVYLSCQNKTWMYARTVFPARLFTGKTRYLQNEINQQPLGKLLFRDLTMRRSAFEIAILQPGHLEYAWAGQQYAVADTLWARRSIFWLQEKPLLLMEVFFPEIFSLVKVKSA